MEPEQIPLTLLSILLLLLTVVCAAAPTDTDSEMPHSVTEGDVINEILHHRGDVKHGLPKRDTPMTVSLTLYVNTVAEANPETGYVVITGYMTQIWKDPRLRFEYRPPFRNIYQVRLPTKEIWTPDIEVYEVAPPGVKLLSLTDQVIVTYNGTVRYYPFVAMPAFCDVIRDKTNDSASFFCQLKIGSWSYDIVYMDVENQHDFDLLLTYRPKGQWVVTSIEGKRNEVTLAALKKTYADVTFSLKIEASEK